MINPRWMISTGVFFYMCLMGQLMGQLIYAFVSP